MVATAHVLVGGAVGTAVGYATGSPVLALGAGIVTHFICDAIPHVDHPPAPYKGTDLIWTPSIWAFALIDSTLAALIILFFWLRFPPPHEPYFVFGAIGGYLPDFIDNVPFWKNYIHKLPGFKQFHAFHEATHSFWRKKFPMPREAVWPKWCLLGIVTQLIAISLSLVYLLKG